MKHMLVIIVVMAVMAPQTFAAEENGSDTDEKITRTYNRDGDWQYKDAREWQYAVIVHPISQEPDGKGEPVFWLIKRRAMMKVLDPSNHWVQTIPHARKYPIQSGQISHGRMKMKDTQVDEVFFFFEDEVTRDPRKSDWWRDGFEMEKSKDVDEKTTIYDVLGHLAAGHKNGLDKNLAEIIAEDVGLNPDLLETPIPRGKILAKITEATNAVVSD